MSGTNHGRLISSARTSVDAGGGSHLTQQDSIFDPLGRIIERKITDDGAQFSKTSYIYDGSEIIAGGTGWPALRPTGVQRTRG